MLISSNDAKVGVKQKTRKRTILAIVESFIHQSDVLYITMNARDAVI